MTVRVRVGLGLGLGLDGVNSFTGDVASTTWIVYFESNCKGTSNNRTGAVFMIHSIDLHITCVSWT